MIQTRTNSAVMHEMKRGTAEKQILKIKSRFIM